VDLAVAVAERFAKKNQLEQASKILRRAGAGLGVAGVVFDAFDLANAENTEQRIAAALGIGVGIAVVASGGAPPRGRLDPDGGADG